MKSIRQFAFRTTRSKQAGRLRFAKGEGGDVLPIFAAALIVMVFFVGLGMDASVVLMQHSRLNADAQLVAQDRLTYQDTVRYSEAPGSDFTQHATRTLMANGYDGSGELYFAEDKRDANSRHYKARVVLHGTCDTYFLKLFGVNSIAYTASTDFDDTYGEGGDDVVWAPSSSAASYSGCYSFSAGSVTGFAQGSLPDGWKSA